MPTRPLYSAKIRVECARRRKSGAQIAREVGIPRSTWYRRMRDDDWKVSDLRLIASALGLEPNALLGDEAAA